MHRTRTPKLFSLATFEDDVLEYVEANGNAAWFLSIRARFGCGPGAGSRALRARLRVLVDRGLLANQGDKFFRVAAPSAPVGPGSRPFRRMEEHLRIRDEQVRSLLELAPVQTGIVDVFFLVRLAMTRLGMKRNRFRVLRKHMSRVGLLEPGPGRSLYRLARCRWTDPPDSLPLPDLPVGTTGERWGYRTKKIFSLEDLAGARDALIEYLRGQGGSAWFDGIRRRFGCVSAVERGAIREWLQELIGEGLLCREGGQYFLTPVRSAAARLSAMPSDQRRQMQRLLRFARRHGPAVDIARLKEEAWERLGIRHNAFVALAARMRSLGLLCYDQNALRQARPRLRERRIEQMLAFVRARSPAIAPRTLRKEARRRGLSEQTYRSVMRRLTGGGVLRYDSKRRLYHIDPSAMADP